MGYFDVLELVFNLDQSGLCSLLHCIHLPCGDEFTLLGVLHLSSIRSRVVQSVCVTDFVWQVPSKCVWEVHVGRLLWVCAAGSAEVWGGRRGCGPFM